MLGSGGRKIGHTKNTRKYAIMANTSQLPVKKFSTLVYHPGGNLRFSLWSDFGISINTQENVF